MHNTCMSTKTISLRLDAYERLRAARRSEEESFTQVVLRARWPEPTITGSELLTWLDSAGAAFSEEELDRIDETKRLQEPPEEKWNG